MGGHFVTVMDVWGNLGCCRADCGQCVWTNTSSGLLRCGERYFDGYSRCLQHDHHMYSVYQDLLPKHEM